MKVTNEKTENRETYLTIEMESAEMEESLADAYRRLVKKAKIPGFRQGKAPRPILERYLGKESLLDEALNKLVPEAYNKAIQEQEIEAFAQPQIEITQTEPLIFTAKVPLRPVVTLGDYHSIKMKQETVKVTDSDVNNVIEQLRHQQATWEPVERPVDFGDLVVLDIESSIEDRPLINQKGAQYQVVRDLPLPAPGFAEQITGMKRDDEKEFNIQYPSDYPGDEVAGKEAHFKVRVTEIKQEILPELNDEFAREINPEFQTVDSLRKQASSDLKTRAEEKARTEFEEKVIDAVVDISEVEFPPILVELEINRILNQRFQRGNQELEEYLNSINKSSEELHDELHPVAEKRVTRSLVLGKIIEEEKIEVSDSEIDTEIGNMIETNTENREKIKQVLNTPQARDSIEQTLISRKAMVRLLEIAKSSKKTKKKQKEEVE